MRAPLEGARCRKRPLPGKPVYVCEARRFALRAWLLAGRFPWLAFFILRVGFAMVRPQGTKGFELVENIRLSGNVPVLLAATRRGRAYRSLTDRAAYAGAGNYTPCPRSPLAANREFYHATRPKGRRVGTEHFRTSDQGATPSLVLCVLAIVRIVYRLVATFARTCGLVYGGVFRCLTLTGTFFECLWRIGREGVPSSSWVTCAGSRR